MPILLACKDSKTSLGKSTVANTIDESIEEEIPGELEINKKTIEENSEKLDSLDNTDSEENPEEVDSIDNDDSEEKYFEVDLGEIRPNKTPTNNIFTISL